jgi:hypothetical protein
VEGRQAAERGCRGAHFICSAHACTVSICDGVRSVCRAAATKSAFRSAVSFIASRTCEGTGPAMRAGCVLLLLVLPCALGVTAPSLRHVRACPPCPLSCAFGSDLSRRRTSRPALTRAATHTMLGGSCSTARPPTPWPIGFGANLRASAREGRATTMHDTGCVFIVLHHPGLFSDLP